MRKMNFILCGTDGMLIDYSECDKLYERLGGRFVIEHGYYAELIKQLEDCR